MLNKTEDLLNQIAEECSEVAHRASKAIRFGLDESREDRPSNIRLLCEEMNDLIGAFEMLDEHLNGEIDKQFTYEEADDWVQKRKEKIEKYYEYSQSQGCAE